MSKIDEYREFLKSVRSSLGYWKSYSLLQFTGALTRIMQLDKVSGKELASRLGISATQVSKVLRGNENVTIETMAKFADALDAVVHVHVVKKGVQVQWREIPTESNTARTMLSIPTAQGAAGSSPAATRAASRGVPSAKVRSRIRRGASG